MRESCAVSRLSGYLANYLTSEALGWAIRNRTCVPASNLISLRSLVKTVTAGGVVKRQDNESPGKPIAPCESVFSSRPFRISPFIRAVLRVAVESTLLEGDSSPGRAALFGPLPTILGSLECIIP